MEQRLKNEIEIKRSGHQQEEQQSYMYAAQQMAGNSATTALR